MVKFTLKKVIFSVTELKIRGGTDEKGAAEGAALFGERKIFIFWVNN